MKICREQCVMEEKYNKREKIKCIVFLLLSILWMAVIFMFSAQTGEESDAQSGFLTNLICKLIPFQLSEGGIDNLTLIIRKMAHFTEYAILGVLYFNTAHYFMAYRKNEKNIYGGNGRAACKAVAFTTALCMLYAMSDEFHQSFTDGRSPALRDVIIDMCGGFAGSMLALLIINIAAGKDRRGKENDSKENDRICRK